MSTQKSKEEELKEQELKNVNGGSDSSSSGDLGSSLNIDNLASFTNESQDEDEHSKSSSSIGKGINLDTNGMFDKTND